MNRLGGAMRPYFAEQHFDWARIIPTHWDPPPMQAFNAIWAGADRVRGRGEDVESISVWLNASEEFCDDLVKYAAISELGGDLKVHRVHPVLGLLSNHLPLPAEFQYLEVGFQFREASSAASNKAHKEPGGPEEATGQAEAG